MGKLRIQDLDLKGKRVLVRVDFNVPQDEKQNITDDTRIVSSLPTIEYILKEGGSVILMSHLGRPKGKPAPEFSLAPCAKRLSELLKKKISLAPDCVGDKVEEMAKALKPGELLLLENLRFHEAEEKPSKDPEFAKKLAKLAEIYINDAFGAAHREHSSTATIASHFPSRAAAGFLMQREISFLGEALLHPKKPFYAIIGGAKVSSKLGVLYALLDKVDALFIGGGMSYTFLKAQGISIGNSICEEELLEKAKEILRLAKEKNIALHLPLDLVIAKEFKADAESQVVLSQKGIPDGFQGMDMGPLTREKWKKEFKFAKTIFWNGPVGVFEFDSFAKGTESVARGVAASGAVTIVGGGDSIAALQKLNLVEKMSHVSTGGGASLEYIEFGKLPGVEALTTIDK